MASRSALETRDRSKLTERSEFETKQKGTFFFKIKIRTVDYLGREREKKKKELGHENWESFRKRKKKAMTRKKNLQHKWPKPLITEASLFIIDFFFSH